MNIVVPLIYRQFLQDNKQRVFDDGILYDYDEILERYETLEFAEYAKGFIPIGNDNGDYELVMKASEGETQFAIVEQGSLGSAEPELWEDFSEWYLKGPDFDFFQSNDNGNPIVNVFIKELPKENRVKVLLKIKKAFVLDMATSDLLKMTDNLPCIITNMYFKAQAERRIKDNDLQDWVAYK